jgi:hypothetical protein
LWKDLISSPGRLSLWMAGGSSRERGSQVNGFASKTSPSIR